MKTSFHHALATAGLACVLSLPTLAATMAAVSDIPAGIGQQPVTPTGSALPPGTQPGAGKGADTDGSSIRPETRMTPEGRQDLEKDPAIERQPTPLIKPGDEDDKVIRKDSH